MNQTLYKNFNLFIFKKRNAHNDDLIINFLKQFGPAPPHLIAIVTGISVSKVSQRLKQLKRYGIVKKKYRRLIPFYTLNEKSEKNE
jgi:DNA-binding HxlR family transcriptional regulator